MATSVTMQRNEMGASGRETGLVSRVNRTPSPHAVQVRPTSPERDLAASQMWGTATRVRHDLVEAVRAQIARGGYDTLDRLDAAADLLLTSL